MTTGSIGSHRAFMGVSLTLSACLVLVLYIGWQIYFAMAEKRNALLESDRRNPAQTADLKKLGLLIDTETAPPPRSAPDAVSLVMEHQPAVTAPTARAGTTTAAPTTTPGAPSSASASSSAAPAYPAVSSIKEMQLLETSEEVMQAVALLDQYWATPAWKDRLPLVVDAGRVTPLMKDFYETQKGVDPVPTSLISKARYQIDGTDILYFRYNGNRASGTVEIAMRRGSEARFQIDWESLVGYGDMSFADVRAQRPAKPVLLRVFARQFEYYNFEFSDATRYYCAKLTSADGENSLYAYAERGTPLGEWLSTTLAGTGPTATMGITVKVAFPPAAESNQCVHLQQVVASRWLVMP